MRSTYFAGLLGVALTIGAFGPLTRDFSTGRQTPRLPGHTADLVTGTPVLVIAKASGEALSCEQIRDSDEVEQIADESYCG